MFALASNDYQTAKQIVQNVLIPKPKKVHYIDEIIEKYIESQKDYVRSTTIKNHRCKLKHLKDFQKKFNQRFTVNDFDLKTADKYHSFIKDQGKTQRNTNATRNIIFIKMVLYKMMSQFEYDTFGIINYTGVKDANPKPVFLNSTDREKLLNWEPISLYLRNVRDLFLFQCYSGLSFSDLGIFEIAEKNGIELIQGKRFKNGNPYVCPLLTEAKTILERHNYKLPLMTNEPYNRGLKEVCAINGIEIKIRLTSHVGRKTFATMMNDRGVSRESVAVMLGHSSLQTSEQHYIGFSPERIFLELDKIG
jgi:integrase